MTPYVANQFEILPECLLEPFDVVTHVGESIRAERVIEIVWCLFFIKTLVKT